MSSLNAQLIGVWKLVSYVDELGGQDAGHPFGMQPEGFLIYTQDGLVSAQLMKPGRARFQSRDWHSGTPEEYQEAGRGEQAVAFGGRKGLFRDGVEGLGADLKGGDFLLGARKLLAK